MSVENQQLQDLESLSQKIRALEKLLVLPSASNPIDASNTTESPTEDTSDDIVSTLSPAPKHHQNHSQHSKHGHHGHPNHTPGSLSRRIQNLETTFNTTTRERKQIDEFLQKYESSKLADSQYGSYSDKELLTLQAKIELILAAQEDLHMLSEDSKEIQNLQKCAEIGGLKNVELHYPVLSKLETIHIEQFQETNKVSDKANKLTDDYNTLINTLSEVFISWDTLLTAAEQKVSDVERLRG
ncbi:Dynactin subunit 3 [Entomortierella beljakovae]|nr:Dynactin subunit 3 [Entomortierella beljakovae]